MPTLTGRLTESRARLDKVKSTCGQTNTRYTKSTVPTAMLGSLPFRPTLKPLALTSDKNRHREEEATFLLIGSKDWPTHEMCEYPLARLAAGRLKLAAVRLTVDWPLVANGKHNRDLHLQLPNDQAVSSEILVELAIIVAVVVISMNEPHAEAADRRLSPVMCRNC